MLLSGAVESHPPCTVVIMQAAPSDSERLESKPRESISGGSKEKKRGREKKEPSIK